MEWGSRIRIFFFIAFINLFVFAEEVKVELLFKDGTSMTGVLLDYGQRVYRIRVNGKLILYSEKDVHTVRFYAKDKADSPKQKTTKKDKTTLDKALIERTSYVVQNGDSLAKISKKFYGSVSKWRFIFEANRERLKEEKQLKEGMKLTIPNIEEVKILEQDIEKILTENKITLDFKETPLIEILTFIQSIANLNIVFEPHLKQDIPITLNVSDVSLKNALELLLDFSDLSYGYVDNILIIRHKGANLIRQKGKKNLFHSKKAKRVLDDWALLENSRFVEKWKDLKITLDFADAPLQMVVHFLNEISESNIVLDPKVMKLFSEEQLKVNINVTDVSLLKALKALSFALDLKIKIEGRVLLLTCFSSDLKEFHEKQAKILEEIIYLANASLPSLPKNEEIKELQRKIEVLLKKFQEVKKLGDFEEAKGILENVREMQQELNRVGKQIQLDYIRQLAEEKRYEEAMLSINKFRQKLANEAELFGYQIGSEELLQQKEIAEELRILVEKFENSESVTEQHERENLLREYEIAKLKYEAGLISKFDVDLIHAKLKHKDPLESDLEQAEIELERAKALFEHGFITHSELEKHQLKLDRIMLQIQKRKAEEEEE